jgi:hypothetical protein
MNKSTSIFDRIEENTYFARDGEYCVFPSSFPEKGPARCTRGYVICKPACLDCLVADAIYNLEGREAYLREETAIHEALKRELALFILEREKNDAEVRDLIVEDNLRKILE